MILGISPPLFVVLPVVLLVVLLGVILVVLLVVLLLPSESPPLHDVPWLGAT